MEDLARQAIDAAPVLAISLLVGVGGVFLVCRLFLTSMARQEKQRIEAMDARHTEFFGKLEAMNDRACRTMEGCAASQDRSTEMLGRVGELLRDWRG